MELEDFQMGKGTRGEGQAGIEAAEDNKAHMSHMCTKAP